MARFVNSRQGDFRPTIRELIVVEETRGPPSQAPCRTARPHHQKLAQAPAGRFYKLSRRLLEAPRILARVLLEDSRSFPEGF